jgi:3',5'-cyclic AMP phosphodiesterase CpdA
MSNNSEIKIIHLSDLHFGTVFNHVVNPLLRTIEALSPDLVVVSGDLTQRAKKWEFAEAADFLDKVNVPKLIVPGNHDIPLFNLYRRFLKPLKRFGHFLKERGLTVYSGNKIFVLGLNTARSFTWKEGDISEEQLMQLEESFKDCPPESYKIVVMHHPIWACRGQKRINVMDRSEEALALFHSLQIDAVLTGHLHRDTSCRPIVIRSDNPHTLLLIQAGTALSSRTRGVPNSFNCIVLSSDHINLIPYRWTESKSAFEQMDCLSYKRRAATVSVKIDCNESILDVGLHGK